MGAGRAGAAATGPGRLPESARRQIKTEFEGRLRALRSPIVSNPDALADVRVQIDTMLDDVLAGQSGVNPEDSSGSASRHALAIRIGSSRAAQGIHPTESLRAAGALFEVALPVLTRECVSEAEGAGGAARLALNLHRAIMVRVVQAAVPYVNFLLGKLYGSHREERERIARELHDRAAHAVGVGLQDLELYAIYLTRDPDRAREKMAEAEDALREALQTIRELSAELRASVGPRGLEAALRRYLQANVPPEVEVSFTARGDTTRLPREVSEELYLVVREAVRNALVHGHASAVHVDLELTDSELQAVVGDNGKGFDVDEALRALDSEGATTPAGIGVTSMRERVDLLGGTLHVSSALGVGTTVEVRLPVSEALR